tara:strand:- start:727 stop:954 length:228 start_codon:yes stop_codon:yes gene_type:complete
VRTGKVICCHSVRKNRRRWKTMFIQLNDMRVYVCDDCQVNITAEEDELGGQCKKCIERDEDNHRDYVNEMFYGRR